MNTIQGIGIIFLLALCSVSGLVFASQNIPSKGCVGLANCILRTTTTICHTTSTTTSSTTTTDTTSSTVVSSATSTVASTSTIPQHDHGYAGTGGIPCFTCFPGKPIVYYNNPNTHTVWMWAIHYDVPSYLPTQNKSNTTASGPFGGKWQNNDTGININDWRN